ncbi:esterase/PHB depolymerase [Bradymonas sediminis]|uniref:Uncharacterized protein n=2 Tax=Bradymonas sediminis TaxID=1548548 RepID=A0A2Z4FHU1_9DELT|nr:PHB depolymerase family esterase [Bradymonas sediminis]AWV88557.1 hypothetical protein DN745_04075 [Bradymonas sediminis]TDP77697.1 esterase/PHB depolymerase [Bradymonas sediminis]
MLSYIRGLSLLALAIATLFVGCGDATMVSSQTSDAAVSDTDADAFGSDAGDFLDAENARDAEFGEDDVYVPDDGHDDGDAFAADDAGAGDAPDAAKWPDVTDEPDSSPDVGLPPPPTRFDCPDGSTVTPGWNTVQVGVDQRRYHIDMPADTSRPPAIVFGFHGFTAVIPPVIDLLSFRAEMLGLGLHPNARAGFPFILVLMQDVNRLPPGGLDWDLRTDNPNVDLPFFEAVVGCLTQHAKADEDRVFAFGFSAGATIANLIHSKYPDVLRAFVTGSGLWANEANNLRIAHQVTLGIPIVNWQWPALEPIHAGTAAVMLTRGGPHDLIPGSPVPASLDEAGGFARDALLANGRVVVDCWHNGGHTLHPEVRGSLMLNFFAAHAHIGLSPLLYEGLPGLPGSCAILRP